MSEVQALSWCCTCSTFANSFNFLVSCVLPVTVFHSTCIFYVYGMERYWPTLQFYVRMCVSVVCRYVAPPGPGECNYNTLLCCDDFSSPSVVSCACSVLCVHSKFGHHLRLLGYLCAKFRFFCSLHC